MNDETREDETMDTGMLTKLWDEYGQAVDAMVADRGDETIGAMHAAIRAYSVECARTGLYVMPGTGEVVALERSDEPSIAEIRERADWKWSSAGIECLVALDGATYVATLVEGEHVQRVKLGAFPEYDCQYGDLEPVAEGEGDDAEPLRIDANLVPMGTVWWLGESAFLVDEVDEGTSAVDHDIDPFGLMRVHDACGELVDYCECVEPFDAERYASARAAVLAELKSYPEAFEPEDSEKQILEAGLDCYGTGRDMLAHTAEDPYPAIYRYFAAHYPAGVDDVDGGQR